MIPSPPVPPVATVLRTMPVLPPLRPIAACVCRDSWLPLPRARSRNLLHVESTNMATTRVYASQGLVIGPPASPGKSPVHFSIIEDPSPPPPPLPPPSPPAKPPLPLPAQLGTHSETHIECQFFENMDFSIKSESSTRLASSTDQKADTVRHCCSLCGLEADCTDFVYEPSSKTCVLLPHVPSFELIKSPNPSTIAGTMRISRVSNYHASCHFEVGSGYAGGGLGAAKPLPGQELSSKQACCDACEREPACAKFIFEKFTKNCQLFASYAEHYFTFGLLSGTVDSRFAWEESSEIDSTTTSSTSLEEYVMEMDAVPPAPPAFTFVDMMPPLPPPGEKDIAKHVLADVSLAVGLLFAFAISVCGYLFFAGDIRNLLSKITGGKMGKVTPQTLGSPLRAAAMAQPKKGKVHDLHVTVKTQQMTQKKQIEVENCESHESLQRAIFDEFGHLLNNLKEKQTVRCAPCAPPPQLPLCSGSGSIENGVI